MRRKVLFIVAGDPRTSARPAEAIRIAAGVGTWKKTEVKIYLRDAAVLAVSEYADEFLDEDNYTRYLPIIAEWEKSVLVRAKAPLLEQIGEASVKYEEISDEALARLAAECHYIVSF